MDRKSIENRGPSGLYVHVPFCSSVCPYCDFAVTIAGEDRQRGYLDALAAEAAMYASWERPFDTVYLGGGTPSSLSPARIEGMLVSLRRLLPVADGAQCYLEINPEDVTVDAAQAWRSLGFSAVSLGVQSFSDDALRLLGRRHDADCARRSLERLQSAGFDTVSVDLIYGIAGQTTDDWSRQLEEVTHRSPDHLSCYQLTVEDGTVFGRRQAEGTRLAAAEPRCAELFQLTHSMLADAGYDAYEVSNFAVAPHHRSRHNAKYWNHTPYLGLGPSAHSFDGARRWWNQRKLRLWQRAVIDGRSPAAGEEELSQAQLALEMLMLGLRTTDGIDLRQFALRAGCDLVAVNRDLIERSAAEGLVELDGGRLRPTVAGLAVAEALARSFVTSVTRGTAPSMEWVNRG